MATYEARLLCDQHIHETASLLAIASIIGVEKDHLKVDRTWRNVGLIIVSFSTVLDDKISSIRRLARVQKVQRIG